MRQAYDYWQDQPDNYSRDVEQRPAPVAVRPRSAPPPDRKAEVEPLRSHSVTHARPPPLSFGHAYFALRRSEAQYPGTNLFGTIKCFKCVNRDQLAVVPLNRAILPDGLRGTRERCRAVTRSPVSIAGRRSGTSVLTSSLACVRLAPSDSQFFPHTLDPTCHTTGEHQIGRLPRKISTF